MKSWLALIIIFTGFLSSCLSDKDQKTKRPRTTLPILGMARETMDSPADYAQWQQQRLSDPATGEIPEGIRAAELAFANKLPHNTERSLTWQSRGPYNKGGRTRAFAFDSQDENTLLVGAVTGGIWRSSNGGQNWVKTTDPGQLHSVTTLVQDTRAGHEDTWYYGTGEYYGVVSAALYTSRLSGDGIFKSTDGGLTWNQLASTASGTPQTIHQKRDMDFVWRLVVDHTDPVNDVVLAAVYNGIWRSEDGGTSWTAVLGLDTTAAISSQLDLIVTPNGTFYASVGSGGPDKGFWRSDDGINWVNISPSALPSSLGRIVMAYDPQNENVIWFFGQASGGPDGHAIWKYRYLTGDGSGSNGVWENRNSGMPDHTCTGFFNVDFGRVSTQSSFDACIAVHPEDSNVIYIGGTNIFRTNDQFTTSTGSDWVGGYHCNQADLSDYVYPNHHPDQHYMAFLPSDANVMYSVNDGGVYRTNNNLADTIDWIDLNKGYVTTQFYTVAIEQGNASSDYLIGGMQDNGTWYSNHEHPDTPWVEILRGDGSYCQIPEGRDYYVTSWQQGRMVIQDVDHNGNVLSYSRIDPVGPTQYNFINNFILDPHNKDRLYLNGRVRVWRQDSLSHIPHLNDLYNPISMGWTMIGVSNPGPSGGHISALEMCGNKPNTVWYGTTTGKVFRLDSANTSNTVQTEIADFTGYVSSLAVNTENEDEIMVTISNYNVPSIFFSTDGGQTWEDVGGNLEENLDGTGTGPAVYWGYIYPDGTHYVGTSVGLFSSTLLDSANTIWSMEGPTEIGNVVINMIQGRPHDGRIAVATHGNGIYEATATPYYNSIGNVTSTPAILAYPNPAKDLLYFKVVNQSETVEVYSIDGQLLLQDKLQNNEALNVSVLSKGTYLYVIGQGANRKTGRFIKL